MRWQTLSVYCWVYRKYIHIYTYIYINCNYVLCLTQVEDNKTGCVLFWFLIKFVFSGTSLVVQWLRLHLSMPRVCVWFHMPHGPKHQNIKNRSNFVTNSIKSLKMVHILKNLKKNLIFRKIILVNILFYFPLGELWYIIDKILGNIA